MNHMERFKLTLTEEDRLVLQSYCKFAEGLSHYLGDGFEIVVHSLENFDQSVIKIINGYHTGRKIGSPITDLALSMLSKIKNQGKTYGDIAYFSKNKKGEPLRSTTITITGKDEQIIGLMCINLYLNTPMFTILNSFMPKAPESSFEGAGDPENFVEDVDQLIEDAVNQIQNEVFKDPDIPTNCKNKEIVERLCQKGIFNLKDSVVKVASMLNISKNTVYMHVRNSNRTQTKKSLPII